MEVGIQTQVAQSQLHYPLYHTDMKLHLRTMFTCTMHVFLYLFLLFTQRIFIYSRTMIHGRSFPVAKAAGVCLPNMEISAKLSGNLICILWLLHTPQSTSL